MHGARRTILVIITGTPTPMVACRVARIDNLHRDRRATGHAIIVCIESTGGELVATTACGSTVRLAAAVDASLEEFLVDGAIVDARTPRPFP